MKKRTLNELRQVKTYGYRPPSPSRKKGLEEKETQEVKDNEKILPKNSDTSKELEEDEQ